MKIQRKGYAFVTNNLVAEQRLHKVCSSLASYHINITLVGKKSKVYKVSSLPYQTAFIKSWFKKGILFYLSYNISIFFFLLFKKFDFILANDADTLLGCSLVALLRRKKLYYDSHEVFTQVPEIEHKPIVQKVWRIIERFSLTYVIYKQYTVTSSVAEVLNTMYNKEFDVVRNLPFKIDDFKGCLENNSDRKIILYQGAVNLKRGISFLIETAKQMPEYDYLIIGGGDLLAEMKKKVNDEQVLNVDFLGQIPYNELKKYTKKAFIGVSLEETDNINYKCSLPNKVVDYIQSNLPVIYTKGLIEVDTLNQKYNFGVSLEAPTTLLFKNKVEIIKANYSQYQLNIQASKLDLVWEKEAEKLKQIFVNEL